MGIVKSSLKTLLNPSWAGTLGGKAKAPWAQASEQWHQVENKRIKGLSAVDWAHQILTNNITTENQEIIIERHKNRARHNKYGIYISVFAANVCCVALIFDLTDSIAYTAISVNCGLQFLKMWVVNLHRQKQVLVGALFPLSWMVTDFNNIKFLDKGVYHKKKLVHPAFPFMGEALDNLKKLESNNK
ncbi:MULTISPECIES: hypothetical protein [Vibrio]|uniref:Uncharacterized protein n=1 Tax=Vibrio tasmaniensis TaxID=212663 RepID=A0A2N7NCU2_9VIBR|nr:hypothetical protein [Vibrio tasmaniensis]PMO89860.1 hypothetical protein BCT01_00845 [Vibrio tasmaniensis]PMP09968.1 hypothetical protein BCS92_02245 [Vibrio tasmaniensis]TKG27966.1 hypothetical protein FC057_22525 [Vibrio tasmaniensis]TKG40549.1 hypothetical protein FC060_23860 [Vibrio tasmaniensis]TKG41669.1 hypothetical protein FC063_07345 [Vibrio tasmaniensis]